MNLHDISNAISENVVTLNNNVHRISNVCSMIDQMVEAEKKCDEISQPYTLHDKLALSNENFGDLNHDLNKLIDFLESKILLPNEPLTPSLPNKKSY